MAIKKIELGWVTVNNFATSKEFFTDILGLELKEAQAEWGWAEFQGKEGGMRLGMGQFAPQYTPDDKPGMNAVLTLTVDSVDETKKDLQEKGVTFLGETIEVPGNVKMATFVDLDGNKFQLVEYLV